MHLVVLYGYQGADCDAEQLALTEQLSDAALGELAAVAPRQPCQRGAHQDSLLVSRNYGWVLG